MKRSRCRFVATVAVLVSIDAPAQAQEQQAVADYAKQSRRFVAMTGLDAATRCKRQLSRLA